MIEIERKTTMIKRIVSIALAMAIMFIPAAAMAGTEQHLKLQDEQVTLTVPQDIVSREGIVEDYTGTANTDLRMKQVFLIYQKGEFYMNLDYIADDIGKEYSLDSEKDAMKMYEEMGFKVLQEDLVSSGAAKTGDFEDPEYFVAADGTPYIKQAIKVDGSKYVNMVVYLTCMKNTLYKAFITYGTFDKKTELFDPISDENIELAEEIIGTYKDSGLDQKFLAGETDVSPWKNVGKYCIIGFILGIFIFMVYFFAKQKGRQRRGKKNIFDKEKDDVVVRSVRDSYADRGKNPNAKKGKRK